MSAPSSVTDRLAFSVAPGFAGADGDLDAGRIHPAIEPAPAGRPEGKICAYREVY